jgi:hypothetical protein
LFGSWQNDRTDILKNIISQRTDVSIDGAIPPNWSKIAGRLEGYVVQDLVDLVDKAIFESCKRTGIDEAKFSNECAVLRLKDDTL